MKITVRFGSLVIGICCWSLPVGGTGQDWLDRSLSPEKRATALVSAMSQQEKFQQLKGSPGVIPELPQCLAAGMSPGYHA